MHPIVFRFPEALPILGGEAVTSFGVFMLLAFLTAGFALRAEMSRGGYDPDKAWDFIFMAVIGGILGGKIYYVLLNFPRLQQEGLSFVLQRSGMVWYGGFLGATALCVWEVYRSKLDLGRVADYVAAPLAIAYAVGRIGCFMVGDDWGRPTSLPWGVRFPLGSPPTRVDIIEREFGIAVDPELIERYGQIVPVHPTQLYEVALSTLIFLVLWRIRRHRHRAGWLFMMWLMMAGAERLLVEFFRAKDDRFFGILTLAQILSMALITVGFLGALRMRVAASAKPAAASGA
ncbi:MAG TPA: prolipoprotein diacylglyceryl transferase [Longimicrobiales bacterium]